MNAVINPELFLLEPDQAADEEERDKCLENLLTKTSHSKNGLRSLKTQ